MYFPSVIDNGSRDLSPTFFIDPLLTDSTGSASKTSLFQQTVSGGKGKGGQRKGGGKGGKKCPDCKLLCFFFGSYFVIAC